MCTTKMGHYFMAFFMASTILVNVPGTCPAQSNDNTEMNKRERSERELSAGQQGKNEQDRVITQKIRRAIVTDKSLSTNAHNVKIITVGGIVTLKGPVGSEQEKRAVEEKAAQIVGSDNVRSQIGIAPKKTRK